MARVLIVGCGGRGQALARDLVAAGHAVRGTTRDRARTAAIAEAGAEPYVGDPDRIATLMEALEGVTIVVWLLATVDHRELHDGRLRMMCEKLVDTPVRGLVYEAAAEFDWARRAHEILDHAGATWTIPIRVLDTPPQACEEWSVAARAAVLGLLGG